MAQLVNSVTCEGEEFDLQTHLSRYNVPDRVLGLLERDSITASELLTFTSNDLEEWCYENQLKTIERRRFVNAVKALPEAEANKPPPNVVKVFLGNEEKEQLAQFDDMKTNIKKMINEISDMNKKKQLNVDDIIKDIDNVCHQMQTLVENLRKNLLVQVKSVHSAESGNLASISKSFENLLKLVEDTHLTYDNYLTPNINQAQQRSSRNNASGNNNTLTKEEISKQILKCKQEYNQSMYNNLKIVSSNSSMRYLTYNINDIKERIQDMFVKIETNENATAESKFVKQLLIKSEKIFSSSYYSICQFDMKRSKLSNKSTIDCDNKHIKYGGGHWSYGKVLADNENKNVQGYSSGQHCWRLYYKNPMGPNKMSIFGICQHDNVLENSWKGKKDKSWGMLCNKTGMIRCNGQGEQDASASFIFALCENQVDMYVDCDKGILTYAIVDDSVENRKYTFKTSFDTNIYYTVFVTLSYNGTEVQVGKITHNLFGKNKSLVRWPKKY